jgi:hypothetical protein
MVPAFKDGDFGIPTDLLQNLISAFDSITRSLIDQQRAQVKAEKAAATKAAKELARAVKAAKAKGKGA